MSDNQNAVLKFFVYIVESPSADELYGNVSEGNIIAQVAALNDIPSETKTVISKKIFERAICLDLKRAIESYPDHKPILHISAHGSEHGLQLSNEDLLTCNDLKEWLIPINKIFDGNLILCMSSCKGMAACRMAMRIDNNKYPFYGMIGHNGTPTWSDTAIAYATFYHHISKGEKIGQVVKAMRKASGDNEFYTITAQQAKNLFVGEFEKFKPYIKKRSATKK